MSKTFFDTSTIVGLNLLLLLPITYPAQANFRTSETVAENNQADDEAQPNLSLLSETLKNFFQVQLSQTESEMEITVSSPTTKVQTTANINTIVRSPNQFRSEIQLGDRSYLVISDGKKAWIYQAATNQYAVTSLEKFQQSDDSFLIGFPTILFLEIAPFLEEVRNQENISESEILKVFFSAFTSAFGAENLILKTERRNLQGKEYSVYQYTDKQEGYRLSLLVDPQTAILEQLHMVTTDQDLEVEIKETITRRVENPAIVANTFSFSPAKSMTQVKSISLEPF